MKKLSRRVCSHAEPPPPEGNGQKYDVCDSCKVHPMLRKSKPMGIPSTFAEIPLKLIFRGPCFIASPSGIERKWRKYIYREARRDFFKLRTA